MYKYGKKPKTKNTVNQYNMAGQMIRLGYRN